MPSTRVIRGLYWSEASRTWHYEFRVRGVKRNGDTGCPSRPLAERWLAAFKARLSVGELGPVALPTLRQALEAWDQANAPIRARNYTLQMGSLIPRYLGPWMDRPLDQVDSAAMEHARSEYLAGQGTVRRVFPGGQEYRWRLSHTEGGANTLLKMVNALYGWLIEHRPEWGLRTRPYRLKRIKVQETPAPILWPEQVQAYLQALDRGAFQWAGRTCHRSREADVRLAVRAQIGLGLREGEALGMDWAWVRWRDGVYQPGRTKNRKTREIPVPGWLLAELEQRWKAAGGPIAGLVMPGEGGRPRVRGYTSRPVAAAGRDLGIPGLHPHRLRAAFATTHYELGTPLSEIQQMMGHADPQTTLGYIIMRPKSAAEAQERAASAMGFRSPPSPQALDDSSATSINTTPKTIAV